MQFENITDPVYQYFFLGKRESDRRLAFHKANCVEICRICPLVGNQHVENATVYQGRKRHWCARKLTELATSRRGHCLRVLHYQDRMLTVVEFSAAAVTTPRSPADGHTCCARIPSSQKHVPAARCISIRVLDNNNWTSAKKCFRNN
ncbi:Uncharacterized protein FWK35_00033467 [Aphis craccivora]|uniref:Uncharacterized protein n=1 Tax=Aphis craccivora TaxID=307492 RepID=A0A6G0YDQ1_APHCR|nr:Uncharacterized protein FWK35_00033467 [Aphis craccivora]